jgi:arylsulfatase A-like enzyme
MPIRTAGSEEAGPKGPLSLDHAAVGTGLVRLLALSSWCGLVAGLLEVGMVMVRKELLESDQLYRLSRHFVWLIPMSNLCVFLALGVVGCGAVLLWPSRGRWLFTCGLAALTPLPCIMAAFPRIYSLAWFVVTLGFSVNFVPLLEGRSQGFRRFVVVTFPLSVALVATLGTSLYVGDWIKRMREDARPLPPQGSANVLLIVLDTVAAGHLSVHGYHRTTTTTLVELADHGIRFDSARATSSWTLPSHASMFTGRWSHELSVGWFRPLDRSYPTLAEFLGDRGYATAGFVANTWYCAVDSGLSRGFTHYQDYIFPRLSPFKMAVLVRRAFERTSALLDFAEECLESSTLLASLPHWWRSQGEDRKRAATVNREFLDWLSRRTQPGRPFFAFLNYNDAHYPYELLPTRPHRFGGEPTDRKLRFLIHRWCELEKKHVFPRGVAFAMAAYDDCIADLDEQLGKLVDELDRRAVLERTWLIITADHGESFGEHAGEFCHGTGLHDTELRVPLLFIPPRGSATKQAVKQAVSLRDLAATIVEIVGQQGESPFPGISLARHWKQPSALAPVQPASALPAFAEVLPLDWQERDYWGIPKQEPPLRTVVENDWKYIRWEGSAREELFHLSDDAKEERNLARNPSAQGILNRLRNTLDRLTGAPHLADRPHH